MEHIGTIIDRSLNGGRSAALTVVPSPGSHDIRPKTLPELMGILEADESLENPDVVLPLRKLRMTNHERVEVPCLGTFGFTEWSLNQCASLLGVRMARWFENASPEDRVEELNRRFSRATDTVRLRTTRAGASGSEDGVLRAFVSPGYSPVPDTALAEIVSEVVSPLDPELRIVRSDITDRTVSYVVKVGEAYRPGGDGEVGDLWGGILVRNSGVGFASLFMSLHLTRLICKNGMTAPLPNAVLVRMRHRGIEDGKLRSLLAEQLDDLPGKLRTSANLLRAGRERPIQDLSAALDDLLASAELPRRFAEPIVDAYRAEPEPTVFGLVQAVTRAAQNESPEVRLELEQAAGAYLARVAN